MKRTRHPHGFRIEGEDSVVKVSVRNHEIFLESVRREFLGWFMPTSIDTPKWAVPEKSLLFTREFRQELQFLLEREGYFYFEGRTEKMAPIYIKALPRILPECVVFKGYAFVYVVARCNKEVIAKFEANNFLKKLT